MQLWIRTRNPDGSYKGREVGIPDQELEGATFNPSNQSLTTKTGRIIYMTANYDGEISYTEEIDNSDPALIAKLKEEREKRDEEFYKLHPELRPFPPPVHVNCRCVLLKFNEEGE
jgi:hypothetical protein